LHWCPTGEFAFLPLHAAGIYDGHAVDQNMCCSDFVVSSYTPTISALLRAQAKAALVAAASVDVLLIGEDCASDPSMNRLWSVRDELEYIETTAKARQLGRTIDTLSGTATIERVTDRIRSANFVHLACHGIQDRSDALESGFHLRNGRLTVSKLMELDLDKAWFAYLSACETAKGDAGQPDQVIHLAAAMMFAGFKSVVATMW
jgi:CHAT domain-containing protein